MGWWWAFWGKVAEYSAIVGLETIKTLFFGRGATVALFTWTILCFIVAAYGLWSENGGAVYTGTAGFATFLFVAIAVTIIGHVVFNKKP